MAVIELHQEPKSWNWARGTNPHLLSVPCIFSIAAVVDLEFKLRFSTIWVGYLLRVMTIIYQFTWNIIVILTCQRPKSFEWLLSHACCCRDCIIENEVISVSVSWSIFHNQLCCYCQLFQIHFSLLHQTIRLWLNFMLFSVQGRMWPFDFTGKASYEEVNSSWFNNWREQG